MICFPHRRLLAGALLAGLILAAAPALRADEPDAAAKGKAVSKKIADYYSKLKNFQVDAKMTMTRSMGDRKGEQSVTVAMTAARPNLLVLKATMGAKKATVVCDGKKLYASQEGAKSYTYRNAPASLATIADGKGLPAQLIVPADRILLDAFGGKGGPRSATYVGEETLDGQKCDRIKVAISGMTFDLWVDAGEKPIFRKWGVTRKRGATTSTLIGLYKNWKLDAKFPKGTFKFTPPAGATAVKTPEPLVLGAPAPDFELALAGGGKVKLSGLKGKKIVVLDFWASWCGPCRKAMPIVVAVTEGLKDKDVVLYAVNLRESAEKASAFMKANGLACKVALDSDGGVAKLYNVSGIPTTVIIGKDGTVQAIHAGMSPDLKDKLTKELRTLVAGKKLAGSSPRKAGKK